MIGLRALAPLAKVSRPPRVPSCELCGGPLGDRHRHVVELGVAGVQCACMPCGILFSHAAGAASYRTVPTRIAKDASFAIDAAGLAALGIPVGLAFWVHDSRRDEHVARYPGPAGVTEAALELETWTTIARATHLASELESDVEALLVYARRGDRAALACYLVPITMAYELAGRLRRSWVGFTGGDEAERVLAEFFADLDRQGDVR